VKRYRNGFVATALVLLLALNHVAFRGHLAVDLLVVGCVGLYWTLFPPTRSSRS
jgi:hypothetical protein